MLGGEPNSRCQGRHFSTLTESKHKINGKGAEKKKKAFGFNKKKLHTASLEFKCSLNP